VYGEPAEQTVVDGWGSSRQLFHRALVNQGYVIASLDNRGTPAPKGAAWRPFVRSRHRGRISTRYGSASGDGAAAGPTRWTTPKDIGLNHRSISPEV
jgi:hypothetical protein